MSTLFIICDTSGSMAEDGKCFIVRNMVRTIDQYFRLHKTQLEIELVGWSDEITVSKWAEGQDYPESLMTCSGALSGELLVNRLSGYQDAYFMIISDMCWTSSAREAIDSWRQSASENNFRQLKVGEGFNPQSKVPITYDAENLLCALKGWIV